MTPLMAHASPVAAGFVVVARQHVKRFGAWVGGAMLAAGVTAANAASDAVTDTAVVESAAGNAADGASDDPPETLTVWGVRPNEVGLAFSATEGSVDFSNFQDRPLLRTGELAEVVPGLAATQHSGSGKANQYFLRGFNLDHGTDFSVALDGLPLNLKSHAHGQGYLDLNFLIPELVQTISYRKGPYSAEAGDFSLAGSAGFSTFKTLASSFLHVEGGSYGNRRGVAALSLGDSGYAAFSYEGRNGPFVVDEDLRKFSGFTRLNFGGVSLTAGGYGARWTATDQIPLRAVTAGALDLYGAVDPTDGGVTRRFFVNILHDSASGRWNIYAERYRLNLYSNFTYFLVDPVNGDQFEQADRRWVAGGNFIRKLPDFLGFSPRLGGEARYDAIGRDGLFATRERIRIGTVRDDDVDQLSGALWADGTRAFGRLRADVALRVDAERANVVSNTPANTGRRADALISPKGSLAWRAADGFEVYASIGRGFHSNDARGATSTVDPSTGAAVDRAALLVKGTGAELGARVESRVFSATVALFGLDLASELVFAGDAGATEPSGATRRAGIETLATYAPARWISFDASAAYTQARFRNAPGADRIPLAAEYVVTGGATFRPSDKLITVLTVRRIGPAPLIEDNSARSRPSTVVNARLAYNFDRASLGVDALNLLQSRDEDITYFYASRLPGEPAEGVDDIHLHPLEPRTIRADLRIAF